MEVKHIFEPTPLQCGQAVLAMLAGVSVEEIIEKVGTERETRLADMIGCLTEYGLTMSRERKQIRTKDELPPIAVLSLETPKCWHWSLYFEGVFYDPEYGILEDFPICNRKYSFEVNKI